MHHRLLVAGQVVLQVRLAGLLGLEQGLAQAGHVAVAEDAPAALDEPLPHPVPLGVLGGQEADQGLGHGEAHGHTSFSVAEVRGSRGSIAWSAQVPRIQAWAGSSQNRQERSGSGPAITLR